MRPEIVVLGSLNMDLVVRTARRPSPGETIFGTDFATVPGGKGANQAVAAARLGGRVAMGGRVGADMFGETLRGGLTEAGIDTRHLLTTPEAPTGTAVIMVDDQAENSIVVVSGANGRLTEADVAGMTELIAGAKVLMLQLEVPLPTVIAAAAIARSSGVTVMLDPAPARELPPELLQLVDIITPNEHEAAVVTGRPVSDVRSARLAATDLLQHGVGTALIKLGARGALLGTRNQFEHLEGFHVNAVDTTAAGDTFAGALAVALVEGKPLHDAVTFANAAGALATTRFGAQTSIPTRAEVDHFQGAQRS